MTETVSVIVLRKNGSSVKEIKLPSKLNIDSIDLSLFPDKYIKNTKASSLERECDFEYINKMVSIFAFNDGVVGNENKTELPPPLDKQLYFNNIFVIAHHNNKVVDLSKSEFNEFYETSFGGFDDIVSDESRSSEEEANTSDEDFIVNEDEEIVREESSDSESEYNSEEDTTEESEELSLSSDSADSSKSAVTSEQLNMINSLAESIKQNSLVTNPVEVHVKVKKSKKSTKKSKKKESNLDTMSLVDEEDKMITDYITALSADLSNSPTDFKEIVYKHHDKKPSYVLKWLVNKLELETDKYKEVYMKYRELVK